jgi:hypothetical protein
VKLGREEFKVEEKIDELVLDSDVTAEGGGGEGIKVGTTTSVTGIWISTFIGSVTMGEGGATTSTNSDVVSAATVDG